MARGDKVRQPQSVWGTNFSASDAIDSAVDGPGTTLGGTI